MEHIVEGIKMVNPVYGEFADEAMRKIREGEVLMAKNKVNLIVAGKTGTGKSTLINACFRKKLAETGVGRPVTNKTQLIEDKEIPLRIYDTVGLELTESTKESTIKDIHELIEIHKGTEEAIHCVWYCVLSASNRFEQAEEDLIEDISSLDVPVILVLTQADKPKRTGKFKTEILKNGTKAKRVHMILAKDDEDSNKKAHGKDELIKITCDFIKDPNLRRSWINASSSLPLKHEDAVNVIYKACTAAATAAVVPVPVADSLAISGVQIGMMTQITMVYGIHMTKSQIFSLSSALLGVAGTSYAGRAIFTGLIKLIPGAGAVAGGFIAAGTAVALTYALGHTYIFIMEKVLQGDISLDNIDMNVVERVMKDNLSEAGEYMKKSGGADNFDSESFERISKEKDSQNWAYDDDSSVVMENSLQSNNRQYSSNKPEDKGGFFQKFTNLFRKK